MILYEDSQPFFQLSKQACNGQGIEFREGAEQGRGFGEAGDLLLAEAKHVHQRRSKRLIDFPCIAECHVYYPFHPGTGAA